MAVSAVRQNALWATLRLLVATTIVCVFAGAQPAGAQQNHTTSEQGLKAGRTKVRPYDPGQDPTTSEHEPDRSAEALVQPAGPLPTPAHTGLKELAKDIGRDFVALPSKENLYWTLAGGAAALAAHQADDYVQEHVGGNPNADAFFGPGRVIGAVVPLGGSVGIYVWGRMRNQPKVSHVGSDLIQGLVVAQVMTQALKYTTQRERPDQSDTTSFPSAHAASTFAFATALERHLGWRYAVPAFAGAFYVAASRLPANRHWFSDAVFGATVGIIAGRTVTSREARPYPVGLTAVPGGAALMFTPRRFNR